MKRVCTIIFAFFHISSLVIYHTSYIEEALTLYKIKWKIVCTHTHLHKEYIVIFHKQNTFIYHTLPDVMERISS